MHTSFKIRCSAISQIMTMPRSKKAKEAGELGQTAKTYCKTWLMEQLYTRRKSFSSKYTTKGIEMEDSSIEVLSEHLGMFLVKNEEYFSNDFMTGTPDILPADIVIDVKTPWECFTFPLFDTEPDKAYWWQLQGYMALTGRKKAKLAYILSDAPEHLIEQEARRKMWNAGDDDITDYYDAAWKQMTYQDVDDELKVKIFEFDFDDDAIEQIKERVTACRNYIESLVKNLK